VKAHLVTSHCAFLEARSLGIGRRRRATEEGKIKRTCVRELDDELAIEKRLSAHWFLELQRLAREHLWSRLAGARLSLSKNLNALNDGARGLRLDGLCILFDLVRVTAILYDDAPRLLRRLDSAKIVSSWRQIKATIFMCGLDALVAAGPGSIRAAISGPSHS
jgi:hypothetical protein